MSNNSIIHVSVISRTHGLLDLQLVSSAHLRPGRINFRRSKISCILWNRAFGIIIATNPILYFPSIITEKKPRTLISVITHSSWTKFGYGSFYPDALLSLSLNLAVVQSFSCKTNIRPHLLPFRLNDIVK